MVLPFLSSIRFKLSHCMFQLYLYTHPGVLWIVFSGCNNILSYINELCLSATLSLEALIV